MNRRQFITTASGLLVPALADAGLLLQSSPRNAAQGGGGGGASGITFDAGFDGSGTFADGQTVTITRTAGGWGTKNGGGKPLRWIPFESGLQADATYSRITSALSVQTGCTHQTGVKPTNAAGAARQTTDNLDGLAALYTDSPIWTFDTGKCYVYVERYHDHADNNGTGTDPSTPGQDSTYLNNKTIRVWPAGGGVDGAPDMYYSIGSNLANCWAEGAGGSGMNGNDPATGSHFYSSALIFSAFDADTFVSCEHVYMTSALNTKDGIWNHARDSRWLYDSSFRWMTRETGAEGPIASGYLDEMSNGAPAGFIYYNSLYIDDSVCRIFCSSESSYNAAAGDGTHHHRAICIPTVWADGEITLLLRAGRHASLSGKYLYVVDNSNVATRVGQIN
jgi:hypothetical protein